MNPVTFGMELKNLAARDAELNAKLASDCMLSGKEKWLRERSDIEKQLRNLNGQDWMFYASAHSGIVAIAGVATALPECVLAGDLQAGCFHGDAMFTAEITLYVPASMAQDDLDALLEDVISDMKHAVTKQGLPLKECYGFPIEGTIEVNATDANRDVATASSSSASRSTVNGSVDDRTTCSDNSGLAVAAKKIKLRRGLACVHTKAENDWFDMHKTFSQESMVALIPTLLMSLNATWSKVGDPDELV